MLRLKKSYSSDLIYMFQRCLICTDFTDGLQRLVYFVPSLAKSGLKEIVFLHSVPVWEEGEVPRVDQEKIAQVKESLSPALQNIPAKVTVKVEVPSGEPLETIPKVVADYGIDVILTGTPLRSSWQEKIFGSTSMELAKSVDVPLMIFRPQLISVYTEEELDLRCQHLCRYLLIPYNDEKTAHYLVERIKDYAAKRPENSLQKCLLVWVIDDTARSSILIEHRIQEARSKLTQIKAELEALDLEVEVQVRIGRPLNEIIEMAYVYDISAIAVAADRDHGLLEWTVPSFSQEVLHRSWFPLLFFTQKN
jgi:nucleotide-binding universal stress UspA family protein